LSIWAAAGTALREQRDVCPHFSERRASALGDDAPFVAPLYPVEKVKNWTFRNNIRRLAIPVSVAYGCDPRKVEAILLNVAQDNRDVLTTPQPFVDLEEFGVSSLNFKLYAFIDDITKTTRTRTDLRMTILDAFARAGIIIPFGTDVTIRNTNWLREVVMEYSPDSYAGRGSGNGGPAPTQVSGSVAK